MQVSPYTQPTAAVSIREADVSSVADLPMELWKRIFSFLPKEDRVKIPFYSQQFARHAWAAYVHRPRQASEYYPEDYLIQLLERCGELVHHLDFSVLLRGWDVKTLETIFPLCPNLQTVIFFNVRKLASLVPVLPMAPTLKTVNVIGSDAKDPEAVEQMRQTYPLLNVNYVPFVQVAFLRYALARFSDFFQLPVETRGKVVSSDSFKNLLRLGMDFAEFCALGSTERETVFERASSVRFFIEHNFSLAQYFKIPDETLQLLEKNRFINTTREFPKLYLKEFVTFEYADQVRVMDQFRLFLPFFNRKGVSLRALLALNEEELKSDSLQALINHLDLETFTQLQSAHRKTVLAYAGHIGPMIQAGMKLDEFLELNDTVKLQLVAAFVDPRSGPEIKAALKEQPLSAVLKQFRII